MTATTTRRLTTATVALGLLLAGSAAFAEGFRGGREGAPGRGIRAALATLDLTDDQKAKVRALFEAEKPKYEALRQEGRAAQQALRAAADAEKAQILADANQKAAETRGQADAEAIAIYAAAFGQDPEFYRFLRTLQSYEAFIDSNTTLILPSDSELLQYLNPGSSSAGANSDSEVSATPTPTVTP